MNILWVVNIIFPEAAEHINGQKILKSTGGWLLACAGELTKRPDITLAVAGVSPDVKGLTIYKGEFIKHYTFPRGKGNNKYNIEYEKYWRQIVDDFKPDIINVQGTEFPHSLSLMRLFPNIPTVVTIQGLSSQIAKFHNGYINWFTIISNITLRDLFRTSILQEERIFKSKGKCEIEILKRTKYIIGRTTWDKAFSQSINPNSIYYHCNESLRHSFYSGRWEYENCIPHSIFMSQAQAPYKGVHQLIKALPNVLKSYPDTRIRIGGHDILRTGNWKQKIKLSGYAKYIKYLLKKYKIEDRIKYLGFLDEHQIKEELLKSNIYICPSSIENSPNSLCEAQMLGVPCIGSFVGGIPDFIPNSDFGRIYRFEDNEVLSYYIKEIFASSVQFNNQPMIMEAHSRHNLQNNVDNLIGIYTEILGRLE